jgi:hypothetical protein
MVANITQIESAFKFLTNQILIYYCPSVACCAKEGLSCHLHLLQYFKLPKMDRDIETQVNHEHKIAE